MFGGVGGWWIVRVRGVRGVVVWVFMFSWLALRGRLRFFMGCFFEFGDCFPFP